MSNAPEINSFVNVVNELAATDKDTVSARIAKRLNKSVPWPPTQIESHLQIRSYQKWLESYFPGRTNRGGLGHLWKEAYKRCEDKMMQIDIEEQITAQAAKMIAPKSAYSTSANMSKYHYTRGEKNAIKQMFADGATDTEIGKSIGRSPKAIKQQRHAMRLVKWERKLYSKADDVAIVALLKMGHTHREIATKLSRTKKSIEKRIHRLKRMNNVVEPTPHPTLAPPPVSPAPVEPVAPKPMTESLPWWRRLFG